ncbi:MAG TPA: hypothetical protein VFV37_05750 [Luteibaculaceae bacterium]|nr:hypothetical protein [Luteibaculaceae bacterium]
MLSKNWLVEGIQDFEYKKYILLGFLHKTKVRFEHNALYPHLGQLVEHYRALTALKDNKIGIDSSGPRIIKGIDWEKQQITFEQENPSERGLEVVKELVDYALPEMQDTLELGKERYERIEKKIQIEPIGLLPLYKSEGYYLLECNGKRGFVYRYQIKSIQMANDKFIAISSRLLQTEAISVSNHPHSIKQKLIQKYLDLPNPAVFHVHVTGTFPVRYSLLPITERMLMRQLAA